MRQIFILIAVVFLAPASSAAQTATLTGTVSETVALSVTGITLSGDDAQPSVIRVPLLVRSNSSFKISAVFESQTAELSGLSVVDVHATGSLVSPQAVNAVEKGGKVTWYYADRASHSAALSILQTTHCKSHYSFV
jgi:hypothetical protein